MENLNFSVNKSMSESGSRSFLKCPCCNLSLNLDKKSYSCNNKHSFDIANKGYVNLLLSNQKHSLSPGDN